MWSVPLDAHMNVGAAFFSQIDRVIECCINVAELTATFNLVAQNRRSLRILSLWTVQHRRFLEFTLLASALLEPAGPIRSVTEGEIWRNVCAVRASSCALSRFVWC
jgi:hypothetical protein